MSGRIFIVDTNVLVAGLLTSDPDSPTAKVLNAMLDGSLFFMLSPELLHEYRSVLLRPRISIRHSLTEPEIDLLLTEITANALWREQDPHSNEYDRVPDPTDAHLWALMDTEPKSILITEDPLLIDTPEKRGLVISPATWSEDY
jgi:putative PIN family toxin of toxin-antitoxin system